MMHRPAPAHLAGPGSGAGARPGRLQPWHQPPETARPAAGQLIAAALAALVLIPACTGPPQRHAASTPARRDIPARPPARAPGGQAGLGTLGGYRVGERQVTFVEPAHTGPAGQGLGQRLLMTQIRYPLALRPPDRNRRAARSRC